MKKLIAAIIFLLPASVFAQPQLTTKGAEELKKAFTDAGYFGVPRYTTALLPTCSTANKGSVAFDTTLGSFVVCGGTTWASAGGAPGGADTNVQYNDAGVLGGDSGLTWNKTTKVLGISGYTGAAVQGSEMVVNGTFTGDASGWTLGAGGGAPDWAYASNNVTHGDGGGTTALQPSTPLSFTSGSTYLVSVVLSSWSAGSFTITLGGVSAGWSIPTGSSEDGTYVVLITSAGAGNLLFTPTTTFVGTVDSISAKLMTFNTAGLNMAGTAGTFEVRTPATNSSCVGKDSCRSLSGAMRSHAFGVNSLRDLTSGNNTCMGWSSCQSLTTGGLNTGIGYQAFIRARAQSDQNTVVGADALTGGTSGARLNGNTAIGYGAATTLIGDFNTCVGSLSCGGNGPLDYVIGIGYGANPSSSNQMVIGGAASGAGVTDVVIGHGVSKASPEAVTIRGTMATSGSGPNMSIGPGPAGTTSAAGDLILVRYPSSASAQVATSALYIRSQAKTLTNGDGATNVFQVTGLGAHIMTGGAISFCAKATDGTNDQQACCRAQWSAVDTTAGAGGETCTILMDADGAGGSVCSAALKGGASSGTLVVTVAGATGTDLCTYSMTSVSSLTETAKSVTYTVEQNGTTGTIVPQ